MKVFVKENSISSSSKTLNVNHAVWSTFVEKTTGAGQLRLWRTSGGDSEKRLIIVNCLAVSGFRTVTVSFDNKARARSLARVS